MPVRSFMPISRPRSEAQTRLRDVRKRRAQARRRAARQHTGHAWLPFFAIVGLLALASFSGWHPFSAVSDLFHSLPDRIGNPRGEDEQMSDMIGALFTLLRNREPFGHLAPALIFSTLVVVTAVVRFL